MQESQEKLLNDDVFQTGQFDLNASAPFEVRPFSSSSAADELFNFTTVESNNEVDDSIDSDRSNVIITRAATTNSITSAVTDFSQNSNSASLPFPFYERPLLPGVDDFVMRSKLGYDHIRMMAMYEKKAMASKVIPLKSMIPSDMKSIGSQTKSNIHKASLTSVEEIVDPELLLNREQLSLFVKYVQFYGEEDRNSRYYKGISLADVEAAMRMHSRTTSVASRKYEHVYAQELLMAAFDDLLEKLDISYQTWFHTYSMKVAGNEPKITIPTFNKSIRWMCEDTSVPQWTNPDLRLLRLNFCVEGQTEPTMPGIQRAYRKFYSSVEERTELYAANPIIDRIKTHLNLKKMRVKDFFNFIALEPTCLVTDKQFIDTVDNLLNGNSGNLLESFSQSKTLSNSEDVLN